MATMKVIRCRRRMRMPRFEDVVAWAVPIICGMSALAYFIHWLTTV
jgi:hypothetical protein